MATPGPPRAEKLIFSDKTLACSNDSSPIHIDYVFVIFQMISKLVFLIIGALGGFGFASPGIRSQIIQVFSQPSESDVFFDPVHNPWV